MAGNWVLDCSAVMALVFEEEKGSEVASLVREATREHPAIFVPNLFWYEIENTLVVALRRGRLNVDELRAIEFHLAELPFQDESPPDPFRRQQISEIAFTHDISVYDAAYVEIAQRLNARLKTYNQHLLNLRNHYDFIC